MKHRAFTIWEAMAVLGIIMLLAAILFPVFARTRCNENEISCRSNLRQISVAFRLYLADYEERYPLNQQLEYQNHNTKSDNTSGWAYELKTYLGNSQPFYCPMRKTLIPKATSYTDYYFNNRLASLNSQYLRRQASVIQLGEGNDGKSIPTADYAYSELPEKWRQDKSTPAYRHLDGANYGFVDGHVKWLRPEQVTGANPNGKNFTFATR